MRNLENFITTERDYYNNKRLKKYNKKNKYETENTNSATNLIIGK